MQLDLFEQTEEERLQQRLQKLETQINNVRRGLFQRYEELSKQLKELMDEFDTKLSQDDTNLRREES